MSARKYIALASLLFLVNPLFLVNNLSINDEWSKTYGGIDYEEAGDFLKLNDGILIVGSSISYGVGSFDIWLFKVSEDGNIEWEKTYGGKQEDVAYRLLKDEDGYIIIGYTFSYGNGEADYWVIKVDKEGNEIWNKTFGKQNKEFAIDAINAVNAYIIAGISNSFGENQWDIWLVKIDKEGNEIWNKTYGGKRLEGVYCIERAGNDFIIGGYTSSYTQNWDAWLIKIDEEGNEIWNRTYGGGDVDTIHDILPVNDGFIVVGYTMSSSKYQDALIMKVDENGEQQWIKIFGGKGWDAATAIVVQENSYIISGRTTSFGAGSFDVWLIKIDKEGNEIWNKTFGMRKEEIPTAIMIYNNSYYILAGTRSVGNGDILLIKCADYAPPAIKIYRPREDYLYILDREIMPVGKTIVIGKITVKVEAFDEESRINRIEFYIEGKEYPTQPYYIDYTPPYEFEFDGETSLYGYVVRAVAYYGNACANCADSIYFINI